MGESAKFLAFPPIFFCYISGFACMRTRRRHEAAGRDQLSEKDYVVGYKKPPRDSRFKPGQSGNPRGRPKQSMKLSMVLERTLREKVVIRENGRRRTVTKLHAVIRQLETKALRGNLKALQVLTTLARSAEERASGEEMLNFENSEMDERLVQGILKRMEASREEEHENAHQPKPE